MASIAGGGKGRLRTLAPTWIRLVLMAKAVIKVQVSNSFML